MLCAPRVSCCSAILVMFSFWSWREEGRRRAAGQLSQLCASPPAPCPFHSPARLPLSGRSFQVSSCTSATRRLCWDRGSPRQPSCSSAVSG